MRFTSTALFLALAAGAAPAQPLPDIRVHGAWVRATVPGQKGTGAFMNLTASSGARLVGVSSPVAGVAEVHEMKLDGQVMKMRAVPELALPPGQTVALKPGGYHLMLMDLKAPLVAGTSVPLVLMFTDANGVRSQLQLQLPVAPAAPTASPAGTGHGAHKH